MTRRDLLDGLVPRRPPAELRARVLGAAREAAARPERGLVEMLVHDTALRWCAAVVLALAIANAVAGGAAPAPIASPDGIALPEVGTVPAPAPGLTAREQATRLASALGWRRAP